MKTKTKIIVLFIFLLTVLTVSSVSMTGCGGSQNKIIGVSMPSKVLPRWNLDGENIKTQLQAKGYDVDLQNANDDVSLQISQIQSMIDGGCSVLVIAPLDGSAFTDVLKKAAGKKITVIAYDRLILDTPNVDYYITFNNFDVGVMQGEFIEKALNLKNGGGPYNIEIFAGALSDNNSKFFYNGAMSILQPYITGGKLIVKSGQIDIEAAALTDWQSSTAQVRMNDLLKNYYADGSELHAVLSPNDSIALGIIWTLREAGYGGDKSFPVLTGQDCDIENVKAMIAGEQSMSVFKDTRALASKTVEMIDDIVVRKKASTNDSQTYDNGVKIVPAYMCSPVFADKDNYKRILIDSGYYDKSQLP